MEKTLFLDAGNTRVKAAIAPCGPAVASRNGGDVFSTDVDGTQTDSEAKKLPVGSKSVPRNRDWSTHELPGYNDPDLQTVLQQLVGKCSRVVLSSVKKRFQMSDLKRILGDKKRSGHLEIIEVTRSVLTSARHSYRTPDTLGMDRYLACLGAWSRVSGPVIVSDSGTACTIDVMDSGGVYRGGVIMPGLRMLIDILGKGADGLFTVLPGLPEVWPPDTTTAALQAGTTGTFLAAWQAHVHRLQHLYPDARIFLTGGDAAFLSEKSTLDTFQSEFLVFDGMRYWLEVMRGSSQK